MNTDINSSTNTKHKCPTDLDISGHYLYFVLNANTNINTNTKNKHKYKYKYNLDHLHSNSLTLPPIRHDLISLNAVPSPAGPSMGFKTLHCGNFLLRIFDAKIQEIQKYIQDT